MKSGHCHIYNLAIFQIQYMVQEEVTTLMKQEDMTV